MDKVQKELFGDFPRFVGNPNQFCVFDEGSFDLFEEANNGEANCYSRISYVGQDGSLMLDEVFLDLDGELPDNSLTDSEIVSSLRSNEEFRESVLGEVVEDAKSVAQLAADESIPMIGVYTGKGIHLHLLYEPRRNPKKELKSHQSWIASECELSTFDRQVFGDVKRLCRVPNCQRYDDILDTATGLFTVPFTRNELLAMTPKELVEKSRQPRQIELPGRSRPPFFERKEQDVEIEDESDVVREVGETVSIPDNMEEWLKDVLQMPCMYERLTSRNPAHYVRLNSAILLFNAGLSVHDVANVYEQLNWVDFDRKVTLKHLRSVYRKGYASMSCATMQQKGLCVYPQGNREDDCHVFGYEGGDALW